MMNTGRLEVPSSGCLLPYSYKQAGISKSNLGEGILISYLNNDKVIMYTVMIACLYCGYNTV